MQLKRFLTLEEEADLRIALDRLGCTQKDIAHSLGVHPATMRGYISRGIRLDDAMLDSIWGVLREVKPNIREEV